MMTGNNIFETACAFLAMSPQDNKDLEGLALIWLNSLLAEALQYENANRQANKKELLENAPMLASLDEEIPYCNDILRIALPYGLASYLYIEEESFAVAGEFRTRYLSALYEAAPLFEETSADVYGGGA